ncbi:hypothetical protein PNU79_07205 [Turicibacter sanguinis]|uniref:hypothetical protein n=1 Tax=Turicibacter sanguinis TaxID=154288 RepID=UPI00233094D5|nr:hypothetical protein [Turicibacter sanguinis]MDB8541778.1 hypothetical protein [Turicibacter sanguinis]
MVNNAVAFTVHDTVTGEVLEQRKLKRNEQLKVVKNVTQEQREYCKNKRDMEALTRSLDGFVWVFYANNELLINSDVVSKANVSRLMMLATYMNYDNYLVLDEPSSEKVVRFKGAVEYMSKKDIQRVLNLKDGTFKQFFNEVTEEEILIEVEGGYWLSTNYFYKGEINSIRHQVKGHYIRMFVDTVRQIYNGMKTSKHNLLSYVFQLIPCIHHSTNFLCKDVASSRNSIDYMNIEDICKFLGLSTDKKNMAKFKKDLKSLQVQYNGRRVHLINEVIYSNSTKRKQCFRFNPYLVTSISQSKEIREIMQSLFVE